MQSKMKKMRNNEIHTFCFFKPWIYFESKPVWRDSNSKVSKPLPPKLDKYFVVERRSGREIGTTSTFLFLSRETNRELNRERPVIKRRSGGDDIADHRASDRRWS